MQNLVDGFQQNMVRGCRLGQGMTHLTVVRIQQRIQELLGGLPSNERQSRFMNLFSNFTHIFSFCQHFSQIHYRVCIPPKKSGKWCLQDEKVERSGSRTWLTGCSDSLEWWDQGWEEAMLQKKLPWPSSCSSNVCRQSLGWPWLAPQTRHFLGEKSKIW